MSLITAIIGTILSLILIILSLKYKNSFDDVKEEISDIKEVQQYFDFCIIGFAVMDLFNIDYQSMSRRKVINNCDILYGKSNAKLMNYFFYGAQMSIILIGITTSILLFSVIEMFSFVMIGISVLLVYNITYDLKIRVNTRNENIVVQLPEMISKLALLLNAGLVVRDAWKIVAYSQEKEIYKEMQYIQSEMENGMNDAQALQLFSTRCNNNEVKKFITLLIQNLQIGGREITQVLKVLVSDMWNQKKAIVRRKAQSASQKLLLPAAIIFIGILLLILVPLFTQSML